MTAPATDATPGGPVTPHWQTALALTRVDPGPIVWPGGVDDYMVATGGPACETIPIDDVVSDTARLETVLAGAMADLAARGLDGGASPRLPDGVTMAAHVWRSGHEVAMDASPADFRGWYVLAATTPDEPDSGTVAILDPRAGCAMTAMPGLPWGREFSFRPRPGGLFIAPGWLTSSVRPLERRQTIVVVTAESA